jgi:hypothetical protein
MTAQELPPKLFATDFDGTYALTQEPGPNGMNVARAYDLAVEQLFGFDGLQKYTASGGLRNRAPSEVINQLAPDLDNDQLQQKTEDLIDTKLFHLLSQVGQRLPEGDIWPRLAPGFSSIWQNICVATNINTAVISSGHTEFIRRFHEVHELSEPDIMVTDDDMRPLSAQLPPQECVKPSKLLLNIAFTTWINEQGLGLMDIQEIVEAYNGVIYVGDDPNKDGRLAENFGAPFVHINPADYPVSWQKVGELLLPETYNANHVV